MVICSKCGSDISDSDEKCSTCGQDAGFPNVRTVERHEEISALEERYDKAMEIANTKGSLECVKRFGENMKRTSAVVNVNLDYLHRFMTNDKELYTTYSLAVKGEVRKPATGQNDRHRRTIDAMLFGGYSEQVRNAALSLDGSGLKSWGPFAMKLREVAIMDRATLLEDNPYNFVPKHKIEPGGDIPPGYRSTWKERHKLGVAKLAERISSSTSEKEHAQILLRSTGDRRSDDFIEVHIYGSFDNKAVESVRASSSTANKAEGALVQMVKEHLTKVGKSWIEG